MYNYMKFDKKTDAEINAVISAVRNNHKNVSLYLGKSGDRVAHPAISSGSLQLNKALGIGGYAVGRQIEVWGPESSGKTTLALHAIAECQKAGGHAAFIDAEHALDTDYAKMLGVNLDELILHQPDHAEMGLEVVDSLASSGIIDLIVVDSIAALVPKAELEGDMGDAHVGLMARRMSQALRKLTPTCAKNNVTIIWINQIRYKIGVMFGSPETTTGGNALKFYASQRLDIRRTGSVKDGDTIIANKTKVTVKKNKMFPPYRQALFEIKFGIGIDTKLELLDLAVEHGIVKKAGSWYSHGEERLGQGQANVVARFNNEPELFDTIEKEVMRAMFPSDTEEDNHEPEPEAVAQETIKTVLSTAMSGT